MQSSGQVFESGSVSTTAARSQSLNVALLQPVVKHFPPPILLVTEIYSHRITGHQPLTVQTGCRKQRTRFWAVGRLLLPWDYVRFARYPDTISPARMGFQLTCRDNVSSLPPVPLVAYCSIQPTTCCSVKTLRSAEGFLALLTLPIERGLLNFFLALKC
jgi:hypothetical protein